MAQADSQPVVLEVGGRQAFARLRGCGLVEVKVEGFKVVVKCGTGTGDTVACLLWSESKQQAGSRRRRRIELEVTEGSMCRDR